MMRRWLLASVLALAACGDGDGARVCTASFAFITSVAVDGAGLPVSNLVVTDTVVRTGKGFDVAQNGFFNAAGVFVVFSDSYLADVHEAGDAVRVSGTSGGKGFSATYEFGSDGCHVRKVSGPDTVVVR